MKKGLYILLMAIGVVACSTTSKIPMDDAYYRPENTTPSTPIIQNTPSTPQTTSNDIKQPQTKIEYISVQDTTITVRIKR